MMLPKNALETILRYTVAVILTLNFLGLILTMIINPESYFFGEKLSGQKAAIYLLIEAIASITIAYFLLKNKKSGEILSILYFGYFFIETLITNSLLGFGFLVSPLSAIGLALSIILLAAKKRNGCR